VSRQWKKYALTVEVDCSAIGRGPKVVEKAIKAIIKEAVEDLPLNWDAFDNINHTTFSKNVRVSVVDEEVIKETCPECGGPVIPSKGYPGEPGTKECIGSCGAVFP
jgi:hypothetical protein